jgi:RNA polymerase II subunit A small phosphatase-like protein
LKDLSKLEEHGFDLQRVLIVDDDPRKVSRNCRNAIYVKPFMGERDDDELPLLAEYLALIGETPDFLKIEKRGWRSRLTK